MHFRIVCLIKLVSVVRFGLSFIHNAFNFCKSRVHAFFMHTFFLFFPILNLCCVSILSFLSLSLSLRQTALWHPNRENPLRLGTLFKVLGHPLLFPLTSSSVMRRPKRTSMRTSRTVAFIWNTKLFCRILPTHLSPKSF